MQPYFLPYIGYFQLIQNADQFVVYDNIQYTKKGWINRNRMLSNGTPEYFTIPLKSDSDYLDIDKRNLSETRNVDLKKVQNKIKANYLKAPFFKEVNPLIEECLNCNENNLFRYIFNSIQRICVYLEIKTPLIISSQIGANHNLKGEERVIDICKALNAKKYLNPIGGMELYANENFEKNGIELVFHKARVIQYQQFKNDFAPFLSILDVLMFNSKQEVIKMLSEFDYIKKQN